MKFWLFVFAVIWFFHSNMYFGWNPMPQSDSELWADALYLLAFSVAMGWGRD